MGNRDNTHMVDFNGNPYAPKYFKEKYSPLGINSFKDIPGWLNDSEYIYPLMVDQAKDGDKFVEIGVLLGQSSCYLGQLIKQSGKNITVDAVDLFWNIPYLLYVYKDSKHPYQFLEYVEEFYNTFEHLRGNIQEVIKHGYRNLGIESIISLKTIDEIYSHHMYEDNSLQFVWIDGDHTGDTVYKNLIGYWPKIKNGGYIGGDDIVYPDVIKGVEKFTKQFNIPDSSIIISNDIISEDGCYMNNSFYIKKV